MSLLKLGASSRYEGDEFLVVGLVVLVFYDKFIQMWSVVNKAGKHKWLIQFPNYLVYGERVEVNSQVLSGIELSVGIKGGEFPGLDNSYTLTCLSQFRYSVAEGEINWIMDNNEKGLLYLFQSSKGKHFLLFVNSRDKMEAISAEWNEFSNFNFKDIRTAELWE